MLRKSLLALLFVSGALATPAYANYFSNPYTGVTLNIGSAPNPTPADIRVNRLPVITQDDSSAPAATAAAKPSDQNTTPVAQNPPPAASGAALVPAAAQSR
jgi:hypothetical protein